MPVETAEDRAAFFNADEHGVEVRYQGQDGLDVTIVAIRDRPTGRERFDEVRTSYPTETWSVLRSDVAEPGQGDTLTEIGGTAQFTVQDEPWCDETGEIWTFSAPQTAS